MTKGTFKISMIGPDIDRTFEGVIELKGGEDSLPAIGCAVLGGLARDERFAGANLNSITMTFTVATPIGGSPDSDPCPSVSIRG